MIPWVMIVVGGVMVFSGVKSTNPLAVLKGVLDGSGVPTGTTGGVPLSNVTVDPAKASGDPSQNSPSGNYTAETQAARNAGETVGNASSTNSSPKLSSGGGRVAV